MDIFDMVKVLKSIYDFSHSNMYLQCHFHCAKIDLQGPLILEREPLRFVNVMERSPLQYLSKTFNRSLKVTLPNIRKVLVKVTFPSHLQYHNGSLSKSLRSLKVYFRAVF